MKRILITPLDWGLGHATRCIPIIRELLTRGCKLFVAGYGDSLSLLKAEFPDLIFFDLPGYQPRYPFKRNAMVWKMALQIPKFAATIAREHKIVEHLIDEHDINILISDNRYGCWSRKVPCVFITHQNNILMPKRFGWLAGFVRARNESFMKRFTQCWLPDYPKTDGLAGDLIGINDKTKTIRFVHVGVLSRFKPSGKLQKKYDLLAICSGPEPQRSLFENVLLPQLQSSGLNYFLVRGVLSKSAPPPNNSINFATSQVLQELIDSSDVVIARSGYSTVMDMAALGKKVIFIPTPGQTEQEYLAQRLAEKSVAFFMEQSQFDLKKAMSEIRHYSGFSCLPANNLLEKAMDGILNVDHKF